MRECTGFIGGGSECSERKGSTGSGGDSVAGVRKEKGKDERRKVVTDGVRCRAVGPACRRGRGDPRGDRWPIGRRFGSDLDPIGPDSLSGPRSTFLLKNFFPFYKTKQ